MQFGHGGETNDAASGRSGDSKRFSWFRHRTARKISKTKSGGYRQAPGVLNPMCDKNLNYTYETDNSDADRDRDSSQRRELYLRDI